MSDTNRDDFDSSWEEADEAEAGQPGLQDQGRPAGDEAFGGGEDEGADQDAARPAEDEAPTGDADQPPAQGDETTDEFAGLSEAELRERARALAAEARAERDGRSKAENALRSNEGRFSRAERELNQLRLQMKAATPAEEPKPAEVPKVSGEVLDRIASDYDDIGKVFAEGYRALEARLDAVTAKDAQASEAQKEAAQRDLDDYLANQRAILTEAHPDWSEVVGSDSYRNWYDQQPGWLKDLVNRNATLVDGEAAVEVFSRFKADTAPKTDPEAARRDRQLEGNRHVPAKAPAMEPTGRGSGTYEDEWNLADQEDSRKSARRR